MVSLYFCLWWVSLAEYLLILRVYFPLHGYYKIFLSHHGGGLRPWARLFYVVLPMMLLLDSIINWHVFEQGCLMLVLKLYCFRYYIWTWVVITLFVLWCMLNYLWTYVTCGLYVESCTILVCMWLISRSFMILDGLPDLYGLKYDSVTALMVAIVLVLL